MPYAGEHWSSEHFRQNKERCQPYDIREVDDILQDIPRDERQTHQICTDGEIQEDSRWLSLNRFRKVLQTY